ncbi:MAG: hypothetical protein K6G84_07725 [Lachnospiraceae bacterium]|nr:hypothetical protein [Lachnospiraceae bacterium]
MKIIDAKALYRGSMVDLNDRRNEIRKKREELAKKARIDPANSSVYEKDITTLNLTMEALDEEYKKAQSVMESIINAETLIANGESTKQQAKAEEDAAKEEAKIFETARRIAKGAKVPAKDEKKVMDYSMELYMAAKNAAMLANMKKNKKKEEYDSLWDDEEEKSDNPDPREVADNSDYVGPTPEIASADTVVESVSEG